MAASPAEQPRRLLLLAAGLLAASGERVPMPNEAECPDCPRGVWNCPAKACTGSAGETLQGLVTNFTYGSGACWEDVPESRRAMQVDVDVLCIDATLPMTCDNMTEYQFDNIAILQGCAPAMQAAEDLVAEKCQWACKNQRPVARCLWSFDPSGTFSAAAGGSFERCWMLGRCDIPTGSATGTVGVDVVCKPVGIPDDGSEAPAESQDAWVVAVAVSLAVLCCIGGMVAVLAFRYKRKVAAQLHRAAGEGAVASDGGLMVVGRPVAGSRPAPSGGKQAWSPDNAKGGGGGKPGRFSPGDYEPDLPSTSSGLRGAGQASGSGDGPKACWDATT
mmetsp:Transcript_132995/g.384631  ORF Transcript_132995/g.384631 Transcript_132995/m.384631 type:complete len:332 (-) Transcript_132995:164-1159(-)